jgi:hypothetical protein
LTKMMSIDKIREKKTVIDSDKMMFVTILFPQRERWKNDYEFMVAKMEMNIFGSKLYDSNGNIVHENTDYNSVDENFYIEDEERINEFGLCTMFDNDISILHDELVNLGFTVCLLENNKISAINDSLEYYFDFNKLIFETRIFENNLLVISDWKQYQKIGDYTIPSTYVFTTYDVVGRNNNIRLQKSEVTSFLDYTVRNGTGKPLVSYKAKSSNRTTEIVNNENVNLSQYDEIEKKNVTLSAFPNPASDNINIVIPYIAEEEIEILIFNALGKLVYSKNKIQTGTNLNLDISDYPTGLYLVKAGKGNLWQTTRFTKQ